MVRRPFLHLFTFLLGCVFTGFLGVSLMIVRKNTAGELTTGSLMVILIICCGGAYLTMMALHGVNNLPERAKPEPRRAVVDAFGRARRYEPRSSNVTRLEDFRGTHSSGPRDPNDGGFAA